jgi:hypothetical protein
MSKEGGRTDRDIFEPSVSVVKSGTIISSVWCASIGQLRATGVKVGIRSVLCL